MDNWKKVFESGELHKAEIVKGILSENHINAVLVNKKDSYYHWGHFEVHVEQNDILKSLKIIEDEVRFG